MLILTRRTAEALIIETPAGERITVTVLEVKGNQVRIGTEAPVPGELIVKPLWEADTVLGSEPANGTFPAWSAI